MDELAQSLGGALAVSSWPNNPSAPHPRFTQYKKNRSGSKGLPGQEERRLGLLTAQKQMRYDYVNHIRQLASSDWSPQESEMKQDDDDDDDEQMEWTPSIKKPPRTYKNQLMLSEWLVEVPSDLETNWYLVPCPVGKRCLVMTASGSTRVYTKSGYCMNRFPSHLPGGSKHRHKGGRSYTMLDSIYSEVDRTFYVLDIMSWQGHPVFDSDTEFRFYWLSAKLSELPEIKERSNLNPYRFVGLPCYPCSKREVEEVMASPLPFSVPLDGLLFYNRRTHYTHGSTPLVGWLKAYMVPEILGVPVADSYLLERPGNYISMAAHLKETTERRRPWKKKAANMEEEESPQMEQSVAG